MALRFAYNTNGVSHHRFEDALSLIADSGYDGVALTLDHHHFDPFAPDFGQRTEQLATRLERLGLGLVVETGARFLLDPRRKHEPTLITPDAEGRARRLEFLKRAVDVCGTCRGEAVSFWAGVPLPGVTEALAWPWLEEGVARLAEYAAARGVVLAVEPEPGMLVETVDGWRRLHARVPGVRLALDVGHLLVTQERTPAEAVREFAPVLGTVALEDMKRGVHEHLPFGEGDVDVPSVLRELTRAGYGRLVCVELSRDAHRAHDMVPQALEWLRARLPTGAEVAA
ncbi:sugar phosphate isomerase/epimerase [Corallococcus sp. EGB]|uniref:sugar phosphate isomerase/epimerase family protein n=1 Tax=Corallococcus sp. EGB TaxID=1521117 RepID=UPI001CBE9B5A|nr:sugar phosphate isomerase/epimerase family protein [Corallococcus sp. EGB]